MQIQRFKTKCNDEKMAGCDTATAKYQQFNINPRDK